MLEYQAGAPGGTWQALHVLLPDGSTRERAFTAAEAEGVEVRALWSPPLHRQGPFAPSPRGSRLEVTDELAARSLSLPMSTRLGEDEIQRIAAVVATACGAERA